MLSHEGVHVERYGTLIKSAPQITGAKINSTFSSLQYTLTNRKVIQLPAPTNWTGKLLINLIRASELEEYRDVLYIDEKYSYQFSWINEGEEITKEVSILDILYLFNWKSGEALDLPFEIRDIISKIRHLDNLS